MLFENPYGGYKNASDWPIRVILSSYYLKENSKHGIPDGFSDCAYCKSTGVDCETECVSVAYIKAAIPDECAYQGMGYTKTHRDIGIINAMREWMNLTKINDYNGIGIFNNSCSKS